MYNKEEEEILERNQFEEQIQGLIDLKYGFSNVLLSSSIIGLSDTIQRIRKRVFKRDILISSKAKRVGIFE